METKARNDKRRNCLSKLLQSTAADFMQKDIVSVSRSNTLRDAVELMTEHHIGGLPVMDLRGQCVGLISVTDILNYEQEHGEEVTEGNSESARYYDPETEKWESIRLTDFAMEMFGDVIVSEVMAYDLVSVEKDTPVSEVAKVMHDARVHRVLVLNDQQCLLGIVSSLDFVKLIAEA